MFVTFPPSLIIDTLFQLTLCTCTREKLSGVKRYLPSLMKTSHMTWTCARTILLHTLTFFAVSAYFSLLDPMAKRRREMIKSNQKPHTKWYPSLITPFCLFISLFLDWIQRLIQEQKWPLFLVYHWYLTKKKMKENTKIVKREAELMVPFLIEITSIGESENRRQ